jgi:heptaprenyl diphosphate synthase
MLAGAAVDESQIIEMLTCKTASLCRLALWLGAKLAGEPNTDLWADLGEEFGLIFQLRNDANDFDPTNDARAPYSDLLEMKPTLINARLWRQLDAATRQQWLLAVRDKSAELAAPVIEQVTKSGLIEQFNQELLGRIEQLRSKILTLPAGQGRETIIDLLDKIRQ